MKEHNIKIIIAIAAVIGIYLAWQQNKEQKRLNDHIKNTFSQKTCNCKK